MTAKKFTESIIFNVRWGLNLFYIMIILSIAYYGIRSVEWFVREIVRGDVNPMLFIVEVLDIAMIANLAKMTLTGSYNSFVTKSHGYPNENIGSGVLKIKMATSLINIASIHLLKKYVVIDKVDWEELGKLLAVYAAFMLGALVQSYINYLHEKQELNEKQFEAYHHSTGHVREEANHKSLTDIRYTAASSDGWVQTSSLQSEDAQVQNRFEEPRNNSLARGSFDHG